MNKEQEQRYREEYFKYCEEKGIKILDVEHLEFYLAACKKRNEEIDEIKAEFGALASANHKYCDELTALRAEIERTENHYKDLINSYNNENTTLRAENDLLQTARDSQAEMIKRLLAENDRLDRLYAETEKERKRYHKEFCQERQRVIDSKPSIKHEKENQKLRDLVKRAKELMPSGHDTDCVFNHLRNEDCGCGIDQWLKDAEEIGG